MYGIGRPAGSSGERKLNTAGPALAYQTTASERAVGRILLLGGKVVPVRDLGLQLREHEVGEDVAVPQKGVIVLQLVSTGSTLSNGPRAKRTSFLQCRSNASYSAIPAGVMW